MGKNSRFTEMADSQKCQRPQVSSTLWPVHFGSQ